MNQEFKINNKIINVYIKSNSNSSLPMIILNTYGNEGLNIFQECQNINCQNFILMTISNLNWDDEMTPWEAPNLTKKQPNFKGKANIYLNELINTIIPQIKQYLNNIQINITEYIIAGYSLGGLFALYSSYKTDLFTKIVSASGSFWYPKFLNFVQENTISSKINKIYFSLGNKESKTKNKLLQTTETNTKNLVKIYQNQAIQTIYEESEGNHFQNATLRMAKGIKWILERK